MRSGSILRMQKRQIPLTFLIAPNLKVNFTQSENSFNFSTRLSSPISSNPSFFSEFKVTLKGIFSGPAFFLNG